jgi:hypothetical protein
MLSTLHHILKRIDWMAKNGLNYLMDKPEPDDADPESVVTVSPRSGEMRLPRHCQVYWPFSKGWFDKVLRPEIRKRDLKLDMNHHNLLYWLPPRCYLREYPEWYAEVDGKRSAMWKQLCICTSNSDAVRTLIANVRTHLRENPEVTVGGEAYHDLLWPPRDVAIDPHSAIWLAVHMRDGCRPPRRPRKPTARSLNASFFYGQEIGWMHDLVPAIIG